MVTVMKPQLERHEVAREHIPARLGTVLVALDGSELGTHALRAVEPLLARHHAAIRLARVHVPPQPTELPVPAERQERDRRRELAYLVRTARRLRDQTAATMQEV